MLDLSETNETERIEFSFSWASPWKREFFSGGFYVRKLELVTADISKSQNSNGREWDHCEFIIYGVDISKKDNAMNAVIEYFQFSSKRIPFYFLEQMERLTS